MQRDRGIANRGIIQVHDSDGHPHLRSLALAFVGYLLAAELGLAIPFRAGNLTPFWPAAAVSLSAALLLGTGIWPAIFAADLAASLLHHYSFYLSLGIAIGNTIEPLLAVMLLKRLGFDKALQRRRDALQLFLFGGLLAPMGAALFWVAYRAVVLRQAVTHEFYAWFMWVRSDAIPILLLAPCLLIWASSIRMRFGERPRPGAALTFLLLLAVNALVFGASPAPLLPDYAVEYASFALLVWIALRFGTCASSLSTLVTAITAIWCTLHGRGPFAQEGVLALHLFLLVATITTLTIAITISEQQATTDALARQAQYDPLTGLANRTLFMQSVESGLARMRRSGSSLAVLFIDLDDFKIVNDSLGHKSGDELIRHIAQRLRSSVRAGDSIGVPYAVSPENIVSRIAGDEFTVLLEDVSDAHAALRAAQRIQKSLTDPFLIDGQELFKTASIGIAMSKGEHKAGDLLRDADLAMYRAKAQGGGRCELFDAVLHAGISERLQLEAEIRHALHRGEFVLHYQPIVSLETGRLSGVEALVRWRRPDGTLMYPADFLPLAESTGLIRELGGWVLRQACVQLAQWRADQPHTPLSIAVNVSAKQFNMGGFAPLVAAILADTMLAPASLHLEITESTVMDDVEKTAQILAALRTLGVKVMLDDFGTGYSSMSYLQRFAVDALKIDRSFVSRVHVNRENRAIVNAIVALGQALQMELVAEGIETVEEVRLLQAAGCHLGQGYLFSKPVEAETVACLLRQGAQMDAGGKIATFPGLAENSYTV